jgi:hypothetical protein
MMRSANKAVDIDGLSIERAAAELRLQIGSHRTVRR